MKTFSVNTGSEIARYLLTIFLFITAFNRFTGDDASYYIKQLGHLNLPEIGWLGSAVGVLQLLLVAVLLLPAKRWRIRLLYGYAALALVPMLMLVTHPVWIDSLGSFPAIGAGQGLIKYLGIAAVALYLAAYYSANDTLQQWALRLNWLGVVLVLTWIGGMKFTQIEADGIEGLMRTSVLFSWIYDYFSVLHGSYFIGVIELIAVVALMMARISTPIYYLGLLMAALTFIATQTFIISLPAYSTDSGFWMLTSSGQFIVKDLVLLASCVVLFVHHNNRQKV
ncbi:DUF417 family protein [Shewanella waksmanii]|uniref:DUF417 family protein n=1 Tax=Shewanella waksmanii TaxID=213783 RepID=UPI00048BF141|nr:DUF417 family protein [Shewanella waksmanii]